MGINDVKLQTRLLAFFLILGLSPLLSIGIVSSLIAGRSLMEQSYFQLEGMREVKKSQLQNYFSERQGDVMVLTDIVSAFQNRGEQRLQGTDDVLVSQEEDDFYSNYIEQYGYYDLFLIHPDGDIFYSVSKEADFGTNLTNGLYRSSPPQL
ncbi:MAG: hypothetical protein PF447_10820 [Spirochaetaceae bacterium]|jgi:methyl-accepting chemotaxis protein|nr:hypothetical protein [Spirochaetaceae bacterium]